MIRVNLLPHREERRKASRRQLGVLAVGFAILGLVIAAAVHGVIAGYVSHPFLAYPKSGRENPVALFQLALFSRPLASLASYATLGMQEHCCLYGCAISD